MVGKLEKSFFWLCFVVGIYAIIGFKLIPIILKDQIIKNLDENLTQKATIGEIQFNPFNISAIIHDFKISDTNEQSTISFKEFSIDFALLKSIEKQHISIKYITLKDASINMNPKPPMQDTLFKFFCNFFKHCIPRCLSEFILVKGD